jgi:hypothetical protein
MATKKLSRPAQGDNYNSGKTPRIPAGGDNVKSGSAAATKPVNNNKPRRVT